MDLKSMQLFVHLSTTLNFTKTSQAMHISPSTLSRCIQRVEQELNTILLVRNSRSVMLTEAGFLFKDFSLKQIAQWRELQIAVKTNRNELEGKINIFCSVTAVYSHLPNILDRFRQLHPKVEINLLTGDSAVAITQVLQHQADIAITAYPDLAPSGLYFKKMAKIPLSIIAPTTPCSSSKIVSQSPIRWKKLHFILPEHGVIRRRFDLWHKQLKIGKPIIYAKVAGHEALMSMVALGCGVGVVPDVVIENSPVRDRVQRLTTTQTLAPFDLSICCNKNQLHKSLINAFIGCVTKDQQ
jgi:LysR family positive regulator for ilvC